MTRTFPGVLETLEALDALDVPMAIASTKPTSVLLEQTQELGIRGLFGHIQGTDGFAHKPDPEILYRVWAVVPMPPARTVFVGDSAMDIEAGLAAGVTAIGVTTGAQDRRALIEAGAHAVIDSLGELLGLMA
jgi:phosphoglycolate phosphatase